MINHHNLLKVVLLLFLFPDKDAEDQRTWGKLATVTSLENGREGCLILKNFSLELSPLSLCSSVSCTYKDHDVIISCPLCLSLKGCLFSLQPQDLQFPPSGPHVGFLLCPSSRCPLPGSQTSYFWLKSSPLLLSPSMSDDFCSLL